MYDENELRLQALDSAIGELTAEVNRLREQERIASRAYADEHAFANRLRSLIAKMGMSCPPGMFKTPEDECDKWKGEGDCEACWVEYIDALRNETSPDGA